MRSATAALRSPRPRERAGTTAVVALVTLVGFWFLDTAIDAFLLERGGFTTALLRPTPSEAWMRLLVAALAIALWALRQDRKWLKLMSSALEEAADGVQIAGLDGRVAYSNRAVQEIYGFSPDELRGRHVGAMNADPEFASRVILPALRQEGRWAGELEVRHKDGHTFPIWLTTALVAGPRGKPVAAVGIIRDTTARRRAEEALRRYAAQLEEATRLKDLFADILRHDLLGPVTAIRMTVDVLDRREPSPAVARLVEQLRRSCSRLTELVESAARYAKISAEQELDLQPLDLGRVLEQVVAELDRAADGGARVSLAPPPGELPVRANPLVREVFTNLVSNAIKYGPDGGEVALSVRDGGAEWLVAVADRGPGIPDDDKQRIFTRFERLERGNVKGTGLGLAIAKHIVELHRGRIWVEDHPGGGAVFRVALPKGAAPASPGTASSPGS